mgnify:CR=1 FL=1
MVYALRTALYCASRGRGAARRRLQEVLAHSQALATVHEFRERLKSIWSGRAASNEVLLAQFREWCAQAEASGAPKAVLARLSGEVLLAPGQGHGFSFAVPGDHPVTVGVGLRADPELARMLRYRVSQVRVAIALFAGQRAMAEDLLRQLDGAAR